MRKSISSPKPSNDEDILARTIWGEARGEGRRGMAAIACVVRNRRDHPKRWPNTLAAVCKQAFQFSAWNHGDPNREKMLRVNRRNPEFELALEIAERIEILDDLTNGADHYHERSIEPRWARGKTPSATIGRHVFYRLG